MGDELSCLFFVGINKNDFFRKAWSDVAGVSRSNVSNN